MNNIVGIDPSLTGTAVCVYCSTQATQPWSTVFTSKPADGLSGRFNRYRKMVDQVLAIVKEAHPVLVALEGYSMHSKGRAITGIVEYGAMLRQGLIAAGFPIIEVPPSTLKLFVTGKGNADKTAMVTACVKRWGVEYDSDDEYDAYGLCRLGACVAETEAAQTEWQRKALKAVRCESEQR